MDAYMPGTASLIKEIDKKLMVMLRDGRMLIGYLRSIDQFANLLLQGTLERISVGNKYGDIDRGIFIVRGENVLLLGEMDEEKAPKVALEKLPVEDILQLQKEQQLKEQEAEKARKKAMIELGLIPASNCVLDEY